MLPKKIRVVTDPIDPRKTAVFDGETGEKMNWITAIEFKATADHQQMIVTLCGAAMTIEGVDAEYVMTDADLQAIAARAGYDLVRRERNEA